MQAAFAAKSQHCRPHVPHADPDGLLEGTGKFMRHVKLRPDEQVAEGALKALVYAAYIDMKRRLEVESGF